MLPLKDSYSIPSPMPPPPVVRFRTYDSAEQRQAPQPARLTVPRGVFSGCSAGWVSPSLDQKPEPFATGRHITRACVHACIICMHSIHAYYACMHACVRTCMHACMLAMRAYFACMLTYYACMLCILCMHAHYASIFCILCMRACLHAYYA